MGPSFSLTEGWSAYASRRKRELRFAYRANDEFVDDLRDTYAVRTLNKCDQSTS